VAKGSSFFYTPCGNGISVVIDKLGIFGGRHTDILKGKLYAFDGTNFNVLTDYKSWTDYLNK